MQIHPDILDRYDAILNKYVRYAECQPDPGTSYAHLRWMIKELRENNYPYGKACRWLGFIQGVLIARNVCSVEEERNFTRPYFSGKED